MRKLTMTARDELTNGLARRHVVGTREEKTRILDEFVAITGFHRLAALHEGANLFQGLNPLRL